MDFVADNSVIVGWFSRSQATGYTDRMFARLRSAHVYVPAVWPMEFTNALVLLERRRSLRRDEVSQICDKAAQLIADIESPPAVPRLLVLARQYSLTAYDAAYLELALRLSLPLASKNGALAVAARKTGLFAT